MPQTNNPWSNLYTYAEKLFKLKPWEVLDETTIFAIQIPDTQRNYFISIMGQLGEAYALAAYEGAEALYQFWTMQSNPYSIDPGFLLTLPHLKVSFENKEDLQEDQLQRMQRIGADKRFKNLFPEFTQIKPAIFPDTPDKEHLGDLEHILRESLNILDQALKNPAYIHSVEDKDDDYLFRKAETIDGKRKWKSVKETVEQPKVKLKINYTSKALEDFKKLDPIDETIEMDLVLLPKPVQEPGKPVYFPSLLLLTGAESGLIHMFELLQPFPDFKDMLGKIPALILQKCIENGWRPEQIKYRSPHIQGTGEFLSKRAGIKSWPSTELPNTDQAIESLKEEF